MPGYVALPAYRAPSPINFDSLNEGLDDLSKQFEKNRLLRQAQAVGAALAPDTAVPTTPNALLAQPQPSPGAQANTTNAIDFLKQQEGYAPVAQWDVRQNSGGYGSKAAPGETFTPAKAEQYLRRDMAPVENWLNTNAPNLTPGQRTALTSFGYNLGVDDLERLKPDIQAGNWASLSDRMKTFNKSQNANGQLEVNPGLVNRRGREAALVLDGSIPPPAFQAAPAPSGPNYRAAANKAFEYGNIALGTQLLQQQTELDNQAYTRNRQTQQDALGQQHWQADYGLQSAQNTRAEASAGREKTAFEDAQHKAAIVRTGALAAAVAAEPDPARQTSMWKSLVAMDPEIAQGLQQHGIDPNDVASSTRFMINLARGPVTPKLTAVAPGATLFDENGRKAVFTAPAKPDAAKIPSAYRLAADGRSLEFIPGGPADPSVKGKDKFNEQQLNASNFANMMTKANETIAAMSPKDAAGNTLPLENPKNFLGAIRDGLMPFEGARNYTTPGDTQDYNQIAAQWIRAKLRKESGAAIGKDEMEQEFRTYFPQYGDGPGVLKQKADARIEATKGMIAQAGGAYQHYFPQSANQPGLAQGATPRVKSPAEAQQLIQSGQLKSGDHFTDENGVDRVVH